jgi:hypothetical protein
MPPVFTLPAAQQMPPSQVAVEAQVVPGQPPQLFSSVSGSTHAPPQRTLPEPHPVTLGTHAPAVQTSVALHLLLHAPQLFGSLEVVTQALPHWVSEMSQPAVQVPSLQSGLGLVHAVPPAPMQPPHAFGFVSLSTQTPPQLISFGPQQTPLLQVSLPWHWFPQVPQLLLSVSGSEQVPLQLFCVSRQQATVVVVLPVSGV